MAGISPQMLIYYRKGDDFPKPHYIAGKPVYVKEEAEKWVKPVSKTRGWPKGKKRNG